MFLSARNPETTSAMIDANTSSTPRPVSWTRTATCSTPSKSARTSSDTSTFCPRANPSDAFVGAPSGPNAAATLGPLRSVSASGSCAPTPSTRATIRRGVPWTTTDPCGSRVAPSFSVRPRRTCSIASGTTCGGSSSTPISRASRRVTSGASEASSAAYDSVVTSAPRKGGMTARPSIGGRSAPSSG